MAAPQIPDLPPQTLQLKRLGRELKCPICLSLFKQAASLSCNQSFCTSCILQSMKRTPSCPICKAPTTRREVRAAPQMDSLVAIYVSMESAAGVNVLASQATSANIPGTQLPIHTIEVAEEEQPSPMCDAEEVQFKQKKRQSSKKDKPRLELWGEASTYHLLELYEGTCLALNKGHSSKKHWQVIANKVNPPHGTDFSHTQCKNRFDVLRRQYKKEKELGKKPGNVPSTWCYYEHMDRLLHKTPKNDGLLHGFDGDGWVNEQGKPIVDVDEEEDVLETHEEAFTSKAANADAFTSKATNEDVQGICTGCNESGDGNATMEVIENEDGDSFITTPGVVGKKNKKRRRSPSGGLEKGIDKFVTAMQKIEVMRIEVENKRAERMEEMQMRMLELLLRNQNGNNNGFGSA